MVCYKYHKIDDFKKNSDKYILSVCFHILNNKHIGTEIMRTSNKLNKKLK
jgi:hypothetical protein